jgi:hypothetical protein
VWHRLACLVFWGFEAETGLTGVLHRSDRCYAFIWKSPSFTSRDRSDRWCSPVWPVLVSGLEVWCSAAFSGREVVCWFLGPVALQWLRGLGQHLKANAHCICLMHLTLFSDWMDRILTISELMTSRSITLVKFNLWKITNYTRKRTGHLKFGMVKYTIW